MREIVADGIASFKIFLAYKNFFGVDDGEMYQTLELARKLGVIMTAHCENAELVARLQQKLLAEGKTGPEWHEPSRPESVEAEGTKRFATFLETPGAAGYVVHLSCAKALERGAGGEGARRENLGGIGAAAFAAGQDLCGAARRGGDEARHVAAAAREGQSGGVCGTRWRQGSIDTVGTDHCPFDTSQKLLGKGCVHADPQRNSGHRGARESAVHVRRETRRLDLASFCGCGQHARREAVWTVSAQGDDRGGQRCGSGDLRSRVPRRDLGGDAAHQQRLQRFEGMEIEGRPSVVTVRGKVQVRDGKFVGERGRGRLLKREPMYFVNPMSIDPKRTVAELKELRALTADENGAQRVAWTDTWLKAREWFDAKLDGLPVEHHHDAAGNRWVTLPGESPKALLLGGHLDSVPNGGWLDGCLGVMAGSGSAARFRKEVQRPAAGDGPPGRLGG